MADQQHADAIYNALGGVSGCRALSTALYANIARDPFLRPLFPGKTLHCAIEEFAAFLIQFLRGPAENTQRRWWVSLAESHRRFPITRRRRDAWLRNMTRALDTTPAADSTRTELRSFFDESSLYLINTPPTGHHLVSALSDRWQVQLTADQTITAIRTADTARALELVPYCAARSRPLYTGLLMEMIISDAPNLLKFVRDQLVNDPALPSERYAGRTFLHTSAALGSIELVQTVLHSGLHPDTPDAGGHTPLYAVANQCHTPAGAEIVHLLVRAGADPNAHGGVQHATPLHLAARRDHVEVAAALLDSRASLEARDRTGDTPLRRAVNCNRPNVARLLLSRGADPDSVGSKGLTPRSAARTQTMKSLLAGL
jgi:hemoglobin